MSSTKLKRLEPDPKAAELQAKIEQRVKDRATLARDVQSSIDKLASHINDLMDHDLDTYHMLANPDCLYSDSPVGRNFTAEWIRQYMIKKDIDFVGYFLDGKINIKDFVDRCADSSGWILRFTKPAPAKRSGIEEIVL